MRRIIIILLITLTLPSVTYAQGPDDLAGWERLEFGGREEWRITFYGEKYVGDRTELTASGVPYTKDGGIVAAGPWLLWVIRAHYWREAWDAGMPLAWWWEPGLKLNYRGIASCYPVPVSLNFARWWGCGVRVCAETAGGSWLCQELRVMDTGSVDLEIDLPDETWAAWGYPMSRGVFTGTLEVLVW